MSRSFGPDRRRRVHARSRFERTETRFDLRFPRTQAGKVIPGHVRRTVRYPACLGIDNRDGLNVLARIHDGQARAALRTRLRTAIRAVNSGGDPGDIDIPPVRHRHRAHWESL